MDPIGASTVSLYKTSLRLDSKPVVINELTTSYLSLSKYESNKFKSLLPQIVGSLISASFFIGNGIALAYSSVIIAQLAEPESEIISTEQQNAWIASIMTMIQPGASILCGFLMDYIGRLNTIKLACIPGVLGWVTVALATNVYMIIGGRAFLGLAIVCGSNPAMVYITEIANSNMRMSLLGFGSAYSSLGMVLAYLGGWFMSWRTLAWISVVFIVVPIICCMFIHESPAWLIWKGKLEEAQKTLDWIDKYQPQPNDRIETVAELRFRLLQEEQERKNRETAGMGPKAIFLEFLKPTGYKPTIILIGLGIFQHFTGGYVTLFYSISFIQEAGTTINGYFASILIGVIRFIMSAVNMYMLKRFSRRLLYFISGGGMAIFMFIAGLFTHWVKEGTTEAKWVPVVALLLYVVFCTIAFLFLPIMGIAEMYPLKIRGVGYSLSICINCGIMFASLQSYYTLSHLLGGAAHLQWFYSGMSLLGVLYVFVFLPETKGMKLSEISEYFNKGWTYIGHKHKKTVSANGV